MKVKCFGCKKIIKDSEHYSNFMGKTFHMECFSKAIKHLNKKGEVKNEKME